MIRIRNGIYREKLLIEKKNISLIGEDADKTVIAWSDGAYFQHPDGKKFGTFWSYTVFLGGERAALKDLTVRNDDARAGEEHMVEFVEYACRGPGSCGLRPAWVKKPTAREAEEYQREVERIRGRCAL